MKNIKELQNMASSYNEKTKLQNEKILGRSIRKNIEFLEQAIEYAATHGRYEAMSDNLCDPKYRRGTGYTQEEMECLLRNALIKHFTPQFGIHKAIKHIKGRTSFLLRDEFSSLKSRLPCLWTNSYFVSTVGGAPLEAVKQYIENQELYKRPKKD